MTKTQIRIRLGFQTLALSTFFYPYVYCFTLDWKQYDLVTLPIALAAPIAAIVAYMQLAGATMRGEKAMLDY